MKHKLFLYSFFLFIVFFSIAGCSHHEGPDIITGYKNIKGTVIGKEICNKDETKDYWLISFDYGTYNPAVGDTLTLNGVLYTNVLKTKGLDERLKKVGLNVSIDYDSISTNEIITTGCDVANTVTYQLKEVTILNQFEIR